MYFIKFLKISVIILCMMPNNSLCDYNVKELFTETFLNNFWNGEESISGQGSGLKQTHKIRDWLPKVLKEFQIKTLLDAPCGDFFWMNRVGLSGINYIGIDIVELLIKKNQEKYGSMNCSFICKDLISETLPYSDLILCRDCFVHLPFIEIKKIIKNFKESGAKYLLTTTFTGRRNNQDSLLSLNGRPRWRPLNLRIAPFNFPEPLMVIEEECTEGNGKNSDKSLGLWLLSDLICS